MSLKNELIAGVDEAGRGPLAGPVVAAAVILDPNKPLVELKDSKMLTAAKRDELFIKIQQTAISWAVASASVLEIDELNILAATMLAMQRAVAKLGVLPNRVLVDGNKSPKLDIATEAIIKGDQKIAAISAASILAKVVRDRYMLELDKLYPNYVFKQHKGYPTKLHMDKLQEFGPCKEHRLSFAPVKAVNLLNV